ncbi:hypothetical protein [Bradyrhizobium sp. 18]|uniref:hypothetical protein n=1 Tax=Bradyrhizobium sp. 18 TaxID=2782657 RepID=UPI001FFB418E|nr:hypothetical protein [Bradyrhizobium sp. 18]MCK1503849.1 hypothetical protein [Bradyrhizobium sp. 18]
MSFDDAISNDESDDGDGGKSADPEQDLGCRDAMLHSSSSTGCGGCCNDGASDLNVIGWRDRRCSRRRLLNGR